MGKKAFRPPEPKVTGRILAPIASGGSSNHDHPVFCLKHVQKGFHVADCENNDQAQLALTLERLSKLTWSQIQFAPREGLGTEKIARNAIKCSIPQVVMEDVNLLAIRFSGKVPMVGFRLGVIFHILWFDCKFTLYKHG